MNKMNPNEKKENVSKSENTNGEEAINLQEEQSDAADGVAGSNNMSGGVETLRKKYDELNDSYLHLMAEPDNYRKHTMHEKADLIETSGEGALKDLLSTINGFERTLWNVRAARGVEAVRESVDLIFGKFVDYLSQQGVKPIEAIDKPFDTEEFEAIATIPISELDMKGKVLDCVQTGYALFGRVMHHTEIAAGE